MEYKKDSRENSRGDKRQTAFSSEGQSKNSMSNMQNTQQNQTPNSMSFVFRKSEKLTTALYMVTDIMPEREPMKWKMRETAVDLLSSVTSSMNGLSGERMSALADVLKKTERLISFLDIAQASRMLSTMNASVLKKEYVALKNAIELEWSKIFDRDRVTLSENFFTIPESELLNKGRRVLEDEIEDTIIKDSRMNESQGQEISHAIDRVQNIHKEKFAIPKIAVRSTSTPKFQMPVNENDAVVKHNTEIHSEHAHSLQTRVNKSRHEELLVERPRTDSDKSDRRTIILALIKQRPSLSVKDFTKSIPNVSEKTIQRELLAMVAEGLLEKKGERRWSTYSIQHNK